MVPSFRRADSAEKGARTYRLRLSASNSSSDLFDPCAVTGDFDPPQLAIQIGTLTIEPALPQPREVVSAAAGAPTESADSSKSIDRTAHLYRRRPRDVGANPRIAGDPPGSRYRARKSRENIPQPGPRSKNASGGRPRFRADRAPRVAAIHSRQRRSPLLRSAGRADGPRARGRRGQASASGFGPTPSRSQEQVRPAGRAARRRSARSCSAGSCPGSGPSSSVTSLAARAGRADCGGRRAEPGARARANQVVGRLVDRRDERLLPRLRGGASRDPRPRQTAPGGPRDPRRGGSAGRGGRPSPRPRRRRSRRRPLRRWRASSRACSAVSAVPMLGHRPLETRGDGGQLVEVTLDEKGPSPSRGSRAWPGRDRREAIPCGSGRSRRC